MPRSVTNGYTQAKALGISRNEMIVRAITMMLNFETTFYKKLEKYSENKLEESIIGTQTQNA